MYLCIHIHLNTHTHTHTHTNTQTHPPPHPPTPPYTPRCAYQQSRISSLRVDHLSEAAAAKFQAREGEGEEGGEERKQKDSFIQSKEEDEGGLLKEHGTQEVAKDLSLFMEGEERKEEDSFIGTQEVVYLSLFMEATKSRAPLSPASPTSGALSATPEASWAGMPTRRACSDTSLDNDDDPFIVLTEKKFSILPYTCLGSVLASPDKG